MLRKLVAVGGLALIGAVVPALGQAFSITPGGANAGDGVFRNSTIGTSIIGTGQTTSSELRQTTTSSLDQLFQDWWWFRGTGDAREFTFNNGSSAGVTVSGVVVGDNSLGLDTGGYDWTVTKAGVYSFTAKMRYHIVAGGAGPTVHYSAEITNTDGALNLAMFHYNDYDVNATAGFDVYSINGAGDTFTISDPNGPFTLVHSAVNPSAYQATAFSTLRGNLSDADIDNLNNTVAGSPGDYTGGFQWNLSLGQGESTVLSGTLAFVPEPSTMALLALAGVTVLARRRFG